MHVVKRLGTRLGGTSVVFAILVAFFAIAQGLLFTQPVSALTPVEMQECYNALNGKSFTKSTSGSWSPERPSIYDKCSAQSTGSCTSATTSTNPETGEITVKLTCRLPTANDATDLGNAAAKKIYTDAVVAAMCGTNQECAIEYSGSFISCFDAYVKNNEDFVYPSYDEGFLAQCVASDLKINASNRTKLQAALVAAEGAVKTATDNIGLGTTIPGDETEGDSCAIDGVGWIVCPLAAFLGKVNDGAYAAIEKLLIFTVPNPFSTNPTENAIYSVWSNIRNVANVMFVMAFFAIIFSQSTSIGISAYGIRKMLPRIIIAAIMVNLSYYLCIFAIDISNIIGAGFDGILRSVTDSSKVQDNGSWEEIGAVILAGSAGVFLGIAMVSAAVWATGLFLALGVTALLAIVMTVVILLVRHVALIMIIILSPLAFVAYILPNTEGLFDKWRKVFISLLVMYPLIALLFAGARVASDVIIMTHQGNAQAGGNADSFYMLMALAVLTVPLFGVPWIIKFSGGALARVAGVMNNRSKGLVDRARNYGEKGASDRRLRAGYYARNNLADRGKKLTGSAEGWGKNADGTNKSGFRARYARTKGRLARTAGGGMGVAAGRAQSSWDKTKQRELRANMYKHADEEAYWHRMAKTETTTVEETDADGKVTRVTKKAPTAAAMGMAAGIARSGGPKMTDKVLRTATEAQRKDFIETRGRVGDDASEMGFYNPGSNYKVWKADKDTGVMGWQDIGSDTGGAAVHLTQKHGDALGRVRVTNANGETFEIGGDDADGYMAKAAINMAASAADGSAMTRMMGLKGDPGVDASLIDSLNQSIAANASKLAPKFQGVFAGEDAINGATVDTVSQWHGGQFWLEGRRLAYKRHDAEQKLQAVEQNSNATQQEKATAQADYNAAQDKIQTYYTNVETAVNVMKDRAAASGKTLSPGKLEAFEQFKALATDEKNDYYNPQYNYLFEGGKRPDKLPTDGGLPDELRADITRRVSEQVQATSARASSTAGTRIPRVDIPPTNPTAATTGGTTSPNPTAAPTGGTTDAQGRYVPNRPDGTPMGADEADEYHRRNGGP
ncbi:MAG: hypothetical protein ABIQ64_00950 [Candidatus Saccharimonadales bacterium]